MVAQVPVALSSQGVFRYVGEILRCSLICVNPTSSPSFPSFSLSHLHVGASLAGGPCFARHSCPSTGESHCLRKKDAFFFLQRWHSALTELQWLNWIENYFCHNTNSEVQSSLPVCHHSQLVVFIPMVAKWLLVLPDHVYSQSRNKADGEELIPADFQLCIFGQNCIKWPYSLRNLQINK